MRSSRRRSNESQRPCQILARLPASSASVFVAVTLLSLLVLIGVSLSYDNRLGRERKLNEAMNRRVCR